VPYSSTVVGHPPQEARREKESKKYSYKYHTRVKISSEDGDEGEKKKKKINDGARTAHADNPRGTTSSHVNSLLIVMMKHSIPNLVAGKDPNGKSPFASLAAILYPSLHFALPRWTPLSPPLFDHTERHDTSGSREGKGKKAPTRGHQLFRY